MVQVVDVVALYLLHSRPIEVTVYNLTLVKIYEGQIMGLENTQDLEQADQFGLLGRNMSPRSVGIATNISK